MNDPWVVAAISVAGLLAGIMLTLAGQRYIFGLSRERRWLGYEILTANVIIPKLTQPNPPTMVMVRRSALEGARWGPGRPDELVSVEEVYGFRVRLQNRGNVVLENQSVRVTFDESTKVILANMESAPELGDERTDIAVTDGGRSVVVTFPYLNPKAAAVISVQSVYNGSRSCQVLAAGRGLHAFDMATRRACITALAAAFAAAALATTGGVLLALGASAPSGTTTERLQTPGGWLIALSALPAFVAFVEAVDAKLMSSKHGR